MINVSGLTKYYGVNCAVDNLTFNAKKGEILGFLGPNGAGKTTTMRILTGYMPPTSGKASVGGFDVIDQSLEVRKLVGYLPETVPLYQDMRVFDYLKFMAELRHVSDVEEKVDIVLEQVGMVERSESFISKLSKGMRQRVGLAQALIHQPEVLILDEPTIGLDPAQIIEVRKLIQEIGKEKTVLLSTHILSEAQQVCDRVMIINKGHIVAEDTPEHLQTRMVGSRRVTVRVAGETTPAIAIINKIPGILSVKLTDNDAIQFENPADKDLRPLVAKALIKAKIGLLELSSESVNLEDIFLQLTRDEPQELSPSDVNKLLAEEPAGINKNEKEGK